MTEFNYSQASNTPLVMCKVYLRLHWLFTSFSSRVARKSLSISTPAVPMTISIVFVIFMWYLAWKTLSITFHASIWLPAWPSSRCMATDRKQNSPFSALTRFCYLKSFISEIPELSVLGRVVLGDRSLTLTPREWIFPFLATLAEWGTSSDRPFLSPHWGCKALLFSSVSLIILWNSRGGIQAPVDLPGATAHGVHGGEKTGLPCPPSAQFHLDDTEDELWMPGNDCHSGFLSFRPKNSTSDAGPKSTRRKSWLLMMTWVAVAF